MSPNLDAAAREGGGSDYPWLRSYPGNIAWNQKFSSERIDQMFDRACVRFAARPATSFLGRALTYAELAVQVDRTAAGLHRLGVAKGWNVGLMLPNSPTFIVYYFAILKLGATVVTYNPLYTVAELAAQVRDSDTRLMVTHDLAILFDKVEELLASDKLERTIVASFTSLLPGPKAVLFRLLRGRELADLPGSAAADRIVRDSDLVANDGIYSRPLIDAEQDVAVIIYTGGTTGTPKGAMLTHANISANTQQAIAWAVNLVSGAERVLAILPFFHVFGLTNVLNLGIVEGAEIIILPRFALDECLKLIDKRRPTVLPGVPTLFGAIMNHPKIKSFDLSSIKFCMSGGAALPAEVKAGFEQATGCRLLEGYGLSECSPDVTSNPLEGPAKAGSIGLPLPGTIVALRDLTDAGVDVPPGEKGEICVKGPQVMKGYWKRPEETAAQTTPDGFLRTGDIARMDADGYLFIEDRIKDLIISSGYNVYPRRIEDALYEHQAVEEAIVIGVRDSYRGEAPKAFVKLKAGEIVSAADLMHHLERRISKIEMPVAIEIRDALPKTMIGKLSKKELKLEEARRQARPATAAPDQNRA